jgi:hypothetical protein
MINKTLPGNLHYELWNFLEKLPSIGSHCSAMLSPWAGLKFYLQYTLVVTFEICIPMQANTHNFGLSAFGSTKKLNPRLSNKLC